MSAFGGKADIVPVSCLIVSSATMAAVLPAPKVRYPGLALAWSIISLTEWVGRFGLTTRIFVKLPTDSSLERCPAPKPSTSAEVLGNRSWIFSEVFAKIVVLNSCETSACFAGSSD